MNEKYYFFGFLFILFLSFIVQIFFPSFWQFFLFPLIGISFFLLFFPRYLRYTRIFPSIPISFFLFFFLFFFLLSIFFGTTTNSYSLSFSKNIIPLLFPLFGEEIFRYFVIYPNQKKKLCLFYTFGLFFLDINFSNLFSLENRIQLFSYFSSTIIPLFSFHLLFSYFAYHRYPTLLFRFFLICFLLFFSFSLKLNWFSQGVFSLFLAFLFFILLFSYQKKKKGVSYFKRLSSIKPLLFFFLFFLFFAGFMLGFWNYEPIAIVSNSMANVFQKGDVVIFHKISSEEKEAIPENTIVVYRLGSDFIVHRVIKVIRPYHDVLYETKGDQNSSSDSFYVHPSQILGIYSFSIKSMGWPAIWLHSFLERK